MVMTPVQRELAEALDEIAWEITSTKRVRSLTEAPIDITNGYVAYLFACGQASLGAHARAHAYLEEARSAFANHPARIDADPVHTYMIGSYEARVEQALAGVGYDAPLPREHVARLHQLDRLARYKVDRLREGSLLLELGSVDAMRTQALWNQHSAELSTAAAPRPPAERAAQIQEIVDTRQVLDDTSVAQCLDGLIGLAEDPGVPLLVELLPRIADGNDRLGLYARALTATAHFGWGELGPDLVDRMRGELRRQSSPQTMRVISPSVRAMRRIGIAAELAAWVDDLAVWIDDLESRLGGPRTPARLILASARMMIGDARGSDELVASAKLLDRSMKHTDRIDHIRRLAAAYAHADVPAGVRYLRALTPHVKQMTDTFGTNTHYCLSVLWFVDALVYGLLGLDFSRAGWQPRE